MHPRRLPPLTALRAFEAVARTGSIKAASEELFVTSAAVSQQVKKLEEDLGVPLFVRRHRELVPTEEGVTLKVGLEEAFLTIREVVDGIRPRENDNCVVVACGPPFASKFLAPRLAPFLADNPDLDIRLNSDFANIDYAERGIDIGVRLSNVPADNLVAEKLGDETLVPLASPAYIEAQGLQEPADLSKATLLADENQSFCPDAPGWDQWYASAAVKRGKRQREINFGTNVDQALDAAAAGMGVVLGPLVLASHAIAQGQLVCPFGPDIPMNMSYFLLHREQRSMKPAVKLFKEWLCDEARAVFDLNVV